MQQLITQKKNNINKSIDQEWRKRIEKNPHLKEYLTYWLDYTGDYPNFYIQLSRDMAKIKNPNILYPVGDPIFIHIYTRPDGTIIYHPIEPRLKQKNRIEIIREAEKRLALEIANKIPKDKEEHEKMLYSFLEKIVTISGETKIGKKKLYMTKEDLERLKYEMYCEKIGISLLEPFVRDPWIEDISCSGIGPIYLVHKVFGEIESSISFKIMDELDDFVIRLSEIIGKPISHRNPIVDATLPDGSRINIVFGKDISRRGSNFTIRKFSGKPLSITRLIKFGTMDSKVAAYLWMLLLEGMSIWVSGETASGKTTTLNAMAVFIRPSAKIITIEDTPEVRVPHGNWIREVVRQMQAKDGDDYSSVTMFGLLKAALRQRPNYIIVGEIRGREGSVAFQAMQTGHPVLATFHAASVQRLIQRITGNPINIPKTYIDNLNAVIIQSAVHDPETGKFKRRVISVNEIIGYDPVEGRLQFIEVFAWDPANDNFIFRGLGSSYLFETKIALMRGIPAWRMKELYDELELRAKILDLLVKLEIFDYDAVWDKIRWIHRIGLEEAYTKLRRQAQREGKI